MTAAPGEGSDPEGADPTSATATGPSNPETLRIVDRREARWTGGGGAVVVEVAGELDAVTAPQLGRHLDGLDLTDDQIVHLDLSAVSFIDSSGLRELVAPTRGVIRVIGASEVVRRILEMTGLEGMMAPPPR